MLYKDERSIRRIVSAAGLAPDRVGIDGNAANAWHGALDEASKSSALSRFI